MANELTRRNFIKGAAVGALLLPSVANARIFNFIGKTILNSWEIWDGTEGSNWSTSDTYICIAAGGVGADETGYGYTTGADLVLSALNMPGVSENYRALGGVNSQFTMTQTLANILSGVNNWTVVMKCRNWVQETDSLFYLSDAGGNNTIRIHRAAADNTKVTFQVTIGGVSKLNTAASTALASAGVFWIAIGYNSSLGYFGGFTASGSGAVTQPTRWSDFPTAQRVSATVAVAQFANNALDNIRSIGSDGGNFAEVGWGNIVMSRSGLINMLT